MKYRKITDLTDKEIMEILNNLYEPDKIENIVRNVKDNEVVVDVTTTWIVDEKTKEEEQIVDEIILSDDQIYSQDLTSDDDQYEYLQFLAAKGCHYLFKDNKYL